MFAILTEKLDARTSAAELPLRRACSTDGGARSRHRSSTPGRRAKTERRRPRESKQLEIENLHLKQLIGNLSLEKKLLLDRLAA